MGDDGGDQEGEEVFITAIFAEFLSPPPENLARAPQMQVRLRRPHVDRTSARLCTSRAGDMNTTTLANPST